MENPVQTSLTPPTTVALESPAAAGVMGWLTTTALFSVFSIAAQALFAKMIEKKSLFSRSTALELGSAAPYHIATSGLFGLFEGFRAASEASERNEHKTNLISLLRAHAAMPSAATLPLPVPETPVVATELPHIAAIARDEAPKSFAAREDHPAASHAEALAHKDMASTAEPTLSL